LDRRSKFAKTDALWTVWDFVVHVCIGTALFTLIAGVALAVTYFVQLMHRIGFPDPLVAVISLINYGMVAVDALLFLVFLIQVSLRTFGKLWGGQWER
jgi:hypothetical protein